MSDLLLDMHIWMWCAEGIPGVLSAGVAARIDEARVAGLALVTADRKVIDYGRAGHVRVLGA